jgi:hypothetical protein
MIAIRSVGGSFSAIVDNAVQHGLPYDPLNIGSRSIRPGFSFTGRYMVADAGYEKHCHEAGRVEARSDQNIGLIAVNFLFGSKFYAQPGTSFSQITYLSSLQNKSYDQQALQANNSIPTGAFTQTLLTVWPKRPLTGASLSDLIDTPFQAESGSLEFHQYENQTVIGGFTARITQANFG